MHINQLRAKEELHPYDFAFLWNKVPGDDDEAAVGDEDKG